MTRFFKYLQHFLITMHPADVFWRASAGPIEAIRDSYIFRFYFLKGKAVFPVVSEIIDVAIGLALNPDSKN